MNDDSWNDSRRWRERGGPIELGDSMDRLEARRTREALERALQPEQEDGDGLWVGGAAFLS